MRELSVFVDESGDFGPYTPHSPYFMLSLVFHDQSANIQKEIPYLDAALNRNGFNSAHAVHTAPLIRRELEYRNTDPTLRVKLFDALFNFFIHCDIKTKTVVIDKSIFGGGDTLSERLAKELGEFIREHLEWLHGYDRVVIYYDRGQSEVTRVLRLIFSANLSHAEFRVVHPDQYKLFQVADLVCTLELLDIKLKAKSLSKSEREFFKDPKRLRKNYLKWLERKRIKP